MSGSSACQRADVVEGKATCRICYGTTRHSGFLYLRLLLFPCVVFREPLGHAVAVKVTWLWLNGAKVRRAMSAPG